MSQHQKKRGIGLVGAQLRKKRFIVSQASRRRAIYLLPNLLTTGAIFAGFYAIVAAMKNSYMAAAIALFVAMLLDNLDGRIARMTHTQSEFGAEYDSLSDMVAFGLAPALISYQWSLWSLDKFGWLASFFFTATVALRLARFNSQHKTVDKAYFKGLPCPVAAAVIAGFVWSSLESGVHGVQVRWFLMGLVIILGLLMVSTVRYYSFKTLDLHGRVPFRWILVFLLLLIVIVWQPAYVLFLACLGYMISGPWMTVLEWRRVRRARKK